TPAGTSRVPSGSTPDGTPAFEAPDETHRSSRERRRAAERTTRELAKLEAAIAEHEDALAQIEAQMADPAIYRDGARMRELETAPLALRTALDAMVERWSALADDDAGPA